jgi:hypothetical protein
VLIRKYGILLSTLKEEDIELVRIKRNSELIRQNMHYQDIITPEMQKKWFEKIKNAVYDGTSSSFYFVIHFNNEKIGLINGKNIDLETKTSEGGFFIWEQKYHQTLIPVITSIITLDYTFILNDFETNHIKVIKSNRQALQFNKLLGYKIIREDEDTFHLELTRERYLKKVATFRKIIGKETGDPTLLKLEDLSFEDTSDEELKMIFPLLRKFQQKQVLKILEYNQRIISLPFFS